MFNRTARKIPVGIGEDYVPLHAHIAAFWETENDFATAVGFVAEGLRQGDYCVIFGHDRANEKTCRVLTQWGFAPEALMAEGRLVLLGVAERGDAVLDAIARTFTRQLEAGAEVIRLFGNIGWGEEGWPTVNELLAMEAQVTAAAAHFPCVILCMYETRSIPSLILRHGALETHPFMIRYGALAENEWTPAEVAREDLEARSALVMQLESVQEALKESEERFRLLADTVPVIIWETGQDGRLSFLNRTGQEIIGASLEEALRDGWRQGIHPEDIDHCRETLREAFRTHAPFSMEYRLRRRDGTYLRLAERGIPRVTPKDTFLGFIGTCFDITESSRIKEELRLSNETLEQRVAERTKELQEKEQMLLQQSRLAAMGELLGNIAHQWRQPLNLLALRVQDIVMTERLGDLKREYLEMSGKKMLDVITYMSRTIDDFRSFFNPSVEKVDFRLSEIVEKTVSLIKWSMDAQEIEIEIRPTCDPVINGQPGAFSQVLLNILANARDAFGTRKVEHPVITIETCAEGSRIVLTITDNAGGIPEAVIDRIFDPYFTTKGADKGTGIGLYMSRSIIEKSMHGTLRARNVDGGAQFRIEL